MADVNWDFVPFETSARSQLTPQVIYHVFVGSDNRFYFLKKGRLNWDRAALAFGVVGRAWYESKVTYKKDCQAAFEKVGKSLTERVQQKGSFSCGADDIQACKLCLPSLKSNLSWGPHYGYCQFKCVTSKGKKKNLTLVFEYGPDFRVAFEVFQTVLGEKLCCNLEWNEDKSRFTKQKK